MIVRPEPGALLLITQPDHARLALTLADAWRPAALADHPRSGSIRLAAREHDNGWREEDADPQVDAAGRPVDFVAAPLETKRRLWTRGIDRLAGEDVYAAALVALHAITVYAQRRADAAWDPFFAAMTERFEQLLPRTGVARPVAEADYQVVNVADALSLAFCTAAQPPRAVAGHAVTVSGTTLRVTPDPFGGAVPLRVPARRIPDRPYASAADLRATLDATALEWLAGTANP